MTQRRKIGRTRKDQDSVLCSGKFRWCLQKPDLKNLFIVVLKLRLFRLTLKKSTLIPRWQDRSLRRLRYYKYAAIFVFDRLFYIYPTHMRKRRGRLHEKALFCQNTAITKNSCLFFSNALNKNFSLNRLHHGRSIMEAPPWGLHHRNYTMGATPLISAHILFIYNSGLGFKRHSITRQKNDL